MLLAEEGAPAAVADGVERVTIARVAGHVKASLDALGADPRPPLDGSAVLARRVVTEWRGLLAHAVGEAFHSLVGSGDGPGAFLVGLAAVGVVLADVRTHRLGSCAMCSASHERPERGAGDLSRVYGALLPGGGRSLRTWVGAGRV